MAPPKCADVTMYDWVKDSFAKKNFQHPSNPTGWDSNKKVDQQTPALQILYWKSIYDKVVKDQVDFLDSMKNPKIVGHLLVRRVETFVQKINPKCMKDDVVEKSGVCADLYEKAVIRLLKGFIETLAVLTPTKWYNECYISSSERSELCYTDSGKCVTPELVRNARILLYQFHNYYDQLIAWRKLAERELKKLGVSPEAPAPTQALVQPVAPPPAPPPATPPSPVTPAPETPEQVEDVF